MSKSCLTCRHWDEYYVEPEAPSGERSGSCEWSVTLPYSWRYARREVLGTMGDEGTDCECWESRFIEARKGSILRSTQEGE